MGCEVMVGRAGIGERRQGQAENGNQEGDVEVKVRQSDDGSGTADDMGADVGGEKALAEGSNGEVVVAVDKGGYEASVSYAAAGSGGGGQEDRRLEGRLTAKGGMLAAGDVKEAKQAAAEGERGADGGRDVHVPPGRAGSPGTSGNALCTGNGKSRGLAGEQAGGAEPELEAPVVVLVAKVLTNSDAASGRIILPRVAVEANLRFVMNYRSYHMVVLDCRGKEWEFVFKSWANGTEQRRVYVMEQVGPYLKAHRLGAGDVVGLCAIMQKVYVEANTSRVKNATVRPNYGSGSLAPLPPPAQGKFTPLTVGNPGMCSRSPCCNKPAGHSGFCSGPRAVFRNKGKRDGPVPPQYWMGAAGKAAAASSPEGMSEPGGSFTAAAALGKDVADRLKHGGATRKPSAERIAAASAARGPVCGSAHAAAASGTPTCTRTPQCMKTAGHQGFCSGHKGFKRKLLGPDGKPLLGDGVLVKKHQHSRQRGTARKKLLQRSRDLEGGDDGDSGGSPSSQPAVLMTTIDSTTAMMPHDGASLGMPTEQGPKDNAPADGQASWRVEDSIAMVGADTVVAAQLPASAPRGDTAAQPKVEASAHTGESGDAVPESAGHLDFATDATEGLGPPADALPALRALLPQGKHKPGGHRRTLSCSRIPVTAREESLRRVAAGGAVDEDDSLAAGVLMSLGAISEPGISMQARTGAPEAASAPPSPMAERSAALHGVMKRAATTGQLQECPGSDAAAPAGTEVVPGASLIVEGAGEDEYVSVMVPVEQDCSQESMRAEFLAPALEPKTAPADGSGRLLLQYYLNQPDFAQQISTAVPGSASMDGATRPLAAEHKNWMKGSEASTAAAPRSQPPGRVAATRVQWPTEPLQSHRGAAQVLPAAVATAGLPGERNGSMAEADYPAVLTAGLLQDPLTGLQYRMSTASVLSAPHPAKAQELEQPKEGARPLVQLSGAPFSGVSVLQSEPTAQVDCSVPQPDYRQLPDQLPSSLASSEMYGSSSGASVRQSCEPSVMGGEPIALTALTASDYDVLSRLLPPEMMNNPDKALLFWKDVYDRLLRHRERMKQQQQQPQQPSVT